LLRIETLHLLEQFNILLDTNLDEQQLIDTEVIRRLISDAEVTKADVALEVGSGCGNITTALAEATGRVVAVEKNTKFLPLLKERLAPLGNVELIHGDALRMRLPPFNKLVSNLPFSICEALAQRLIHLSFELAPLIVPSSFADIVTAHEGDPHYSRLSLISNAFFTSERLEEISSDAYYPPISGSTSILRLKPKAADDPRQEILRHVLLQSDKKLKNALREALIASSHTLESPSTKREAKKRIQSMDLGRALLEKRGARLSLSELQLLIHRL